MEIHTADQLLCGCVGDDLARSMGHVRLNHFAAALANCYLLCMLHLLLVGGH